MAPGFHERRHFRSLLAVSVVSDCASESYLWRRPWAPRPWFTGMTGIRRELQGVWCFRFHDAAAAQQLQASLGMLVASRSATALPHDGRCSLDHANARLEHSAGQGRQSTPAMLAQPCTAAQAVHLGGRHGLLSPIDTWLAGTACPAHQLATGRMQAADSVPSALVRCLTDPAFAQLVADMGDAWDSAENELLGWHSSHLEQSKLAGVLT
jgi:hypothetical protein